MFNSDRLFRVLYYLTYEPNSFLVAQDAYAILRSCLQQFHSLPVILQELEMEAQRICPLPHSSSSPAPPSSSPAPPPPSSPALPDTEGTPSCSPIPITYRGMEHAEVENMEMRRQYEELIASCHEMLEMTEKWENILSPLLNEAESFWFCSPIDHTHCISINKAAQDQWRNFRDEAISENILGKIQNFQRHCEIVLETHFKNFITNLRDELAEDQTHLDYFSAHSTSCRLANQVPLYIGRHFELLNHSFLISFQFPATHFHHVDVKFAELLGYSAARLLVEPIVTFGLNTKESESLLKQITLSPHKLSQGSHHLSRVTNPNIARLFYRKVTREIVGIHWDIATSPLLGVFYARGVDITTELEMSKDKQTDQVQRMLKLWLHNLRNASFEQQALVIDSEVQELENKINQKYFAAATTSSETEISPHKESFQNIYDCIKLLIHSTKISVGLINQALNTKGLSQHLCVADFIQSIQSIGESYCVSYGVEGVMKITYEYQINDRDAEISDFSPLYMIGEISMVQAILDHIISNAIRYSDPAQGVTIMIAVTLMDSILQFFIDITDSAMGGLPLHTLNYLQEQLGPIKCTDERYPLSQPTLSSRPSSLSLSSLSSLSLTPSASMIESPRTPSTTFSRASGVGHMIAKYHELTRSGDDFDLRITTRSTGSSFRIRFSMNRMAVPLPTDTSPKLPTPLDTSLSGKVLIVDDSLVIRKILSKYLDSFKCPHQVCVDGSRAWEWFQQHYQECPGVISDLEMPVMGGEALIANIQTFCPGKPCFIVSGNEIPPDKLPPGVLRALLKPITAEHVLSILHEISRYSSLPTETPSF